MDGEFVCVCEKPFNLSEGVNTIPSHLDGDGEECVLSGARIGGTRETIENFLATKKDERPKDCPPGYTEPVDCGACGEYSFVEDDKVATVDDAEGEELVMSTKTKPSDKVNPAPGTGAGVNLFHAILLRVGPYNCAMIAVAFMLLALLLFTRG